MPSLLKFAALGALALSCLTMGAQAQDDPVLDMQTIDCRTMLKMGTDEQGFTLIYFHGYISGSKSETMFNGPVLREATDAIMDYCIDNPAAMLMEAFEKSRS